MLAWLAGGPTFWTNSYYDVGYCTNLITSYGYAQMKNMPQETQK